LRDGHREERKPRGSPFGDVAFAGDAFDWTSTRDDLADLLTRLDEREREPPLALAA